MKLKKKHECSCSHYCACRWASTGSSRPLKFCMLYNLLIKLPPLQSRKWSFMAAYCDLMRRCFYNRFTIITYHCMWSSPIAWGNSLIFFTKVMMNTTVDIWKKLKNNLPKARLFGKIIHVHCFHMHRLLVAPHHHQAYCWLYTFSKLLLGLVPIYTRSIGIGEYMIYSNISD